MVVKPLFFIRKWICLCASFAPWQWRLVMVELRRRDPVKQHQRTDQQSASNRDAPDRAPEKADGLNSLRCVENERLALRHTPSSAPRNLPADYPKHFPIGQHSGRHDDVGTLIGFIDDSVLNFRRLHATDAP